MTSEVIDRMTGPSHAASVRGTVRGPPETIMPLPSSTIGRIDDASPAPTDDRTRAVGRLRALFGIDAATCVASGALLATASRPLARVTGLPDALLFEAGVVLLLFAAAVAWIVARRAVSRRAVLAIVDANVLWAVASLVYAAAFADGATPLGRTVVAAQGFAVGVLAAFEWVVARDAGRG